MTTVNLLHLTHSYDGRTVAVNDLSLSIPSGKITALLGPSGCGKTTTLKMIAGLLPVTSGDIHFNGESILHLPAEQRPAVMAFQNHLLFPYMSVGDNVGFGLKMRGDDKTEIGQRVSEMLELVQLPGYQDRRPSQLSGGQQQRVALARALVVEPQVLLLDEPLSNLDAHLRDEMRELIRSIQQKLDITIIFVTHDQEEAVILADHIALMFDGKLAQFGRPRDFYERPRTTQIARFFGGVNFLSGQIVDNQTILLQNHPNNPQLMIKTVTNVGKNQPITLTIRPEHLEIAPVDNAKPNTLTGRVTHTLYAGTYTRLTIQVGPDTLQLTTTASADYPPDTPITLHLPPEKLWLLPNNPIDN